MPFSWFKKLKSRFSICASSGVYAFVVLKKNTDVQEADVCRQLNDTVSKKIAKYACPDCIQVILMHRIYTAEMDISYQLSVCNFHFWFFFAGCPASAKDTLG